MDFNTFKKLVKEYKTVPVYKRILADLLTPISAYMRLAKKSDYSFILESAEQGEGYGRYSFIGRNPHIILKSEKSTTYIYQDGKWNKKSASFLSVLRKTQKKYQSPKLSGIPHFTGGLVGFMGYESITWVEDIPVYQKDELQCPDALYMLFHDIIAFDHLKNQIILFNNVQIDEGMDLETAYSVLDSSSMKTSILRDLDSDFWIFSFFYDEFEFLFPLLIQLFDFFSISIFSSSYFYIARSYFLTFRISFWSFLSSIFLNNYITRWIFISSLVSLCDLIDRVTLVLIGVSGLLLMIFVLLFY